MNEEEKQERSNNASAEDVDAYLTAVLENLMEAYSITTRWHENRKDKPYMDGLRTKAKLDLIGQYAESLNKEMSSRAFD